MNSKVLLIDDEENILKQMRLALEAEYHVLTALNEGEAMATFQREKPEVVVLDLSLDCQSPEDLGGFRLLEQILGQEPSTRVIIVTGNNDDTNALRAVRLGALDYYSKPIVLDEIKVMIRRATHVHQLHQRLQATSPDSGNGLYGLIAANHVNLKYAKKVMEREYVRKALLRNKGVVSRAARDLGISRVNLYELIAKNDIEIEKFKKTNPNPKRQNTKDREVV